MAKKYFLNFSLPRLQNLFLSFEALTNSVIPNSFFSVFWYKNDSHIRMATIKPLGNTYFLLPFSSNTLEKSRKVIMLVVWIPR